MIFHLQTTRVRGTMTRMRFFKPLAFYLALFCAVAGASEQSGRWPFRQALETHAPKSPLDLAMRLECDLARGAGIFMPDTNRTFAAHCGTIPLDATGGALDFDGAFLAGLAPVEEHGVTVWPVALRVDDETGGTVFYNAEGAAFWEVRSLKNALTFTAVFDTRSR